MMPQDKPEGNGLSSDRQSHKQKNHSRISHDFKIAVVILLFFVTLIRLALVFYLPALEIISDKVFLLVALFILLYLWIQELADLHNLIRINKNLEAAHEQLQQAEIDTIAALIKAEEAKDLYTRGHSERVTEIALAIADQMRLDNETKNIIFRAGVLHDIGKIGISDSILHKKEKLTDEEWQVIKNHPQDSIKILEPLKFLSTERNIILQHHERWDGRGYPCGLRGEEIPREALILAVADAFDAMNSRRSYREPLTREATINELKKCRGTQHSPEVIDALFELLEEKPQLWER